MVPHGAGQPDDEPEQAAPAPAEAAGWQPLDLVTGTLGVLLVIAALLGLAAALWPAELASAATPDGPRVPWWVLAVMFGLVELFVLHVQVRREAQTVSICEIPLVLGLFFASPGALILGRLVGPALVFALHRRQVPIKLGYNLALLCANSVLALAVFAAFHLGARQHGVSTWLATYAAVAAAGALDAVATTVAIAAYERTLNWLDLAREPLLEAARAIAVGTLALVAVYALAVDGGAAVPLVGSALIVLVAYRAYARLNGRHLSLERLYRFSQAVSSNPEVQEVILNVLTEARELLRVERADIVFLSADDQGPAVRMLLTPDGRLVSSEVAGLAAPGSMALRVLEQGTPMLLPHGSREPAKREHLAATGLRDAIIAPLKGDSGVVALVTVAGALGVEGPTATLAGQIVMEGFLHIRLPAWARRLVTRAVAIVPVLVVTAAYGEKGTADLLVFSQVVLSMQLPFGDPAGSLCLRPPAHGQLHDCPVDDGARLVGDRGDCRAEREVAGRYGAGRLRIGHPRQPASMLWPASWPCCRW